MLVLYECLMPKNGHFWPKIGNSSRKKNSAPTSLIEQSPNAYQLQPKPRATFDKLFKQFGQKMKSLNFFP